MLAAQISQTSFTGTAMPTVTKKSHSMRSPVVTTALFTRKKPAPVVVEEPPAKKSLFSFGSSKKQATVEKKTTPTKIDKAAEYKYVVFPIASLCVDSFILKKQLSLPTLSTLPHKISPFALVSWLIQ